MDEVERELRQRWETPGAGAREFGDGARKLGEVREPSWACAPDSVVLGVMEFPLSAGGPMLRWRR
eukprot:16209780-Heterocapsa_arctica.AAC.1